MKKLVISSMTLLCMFIGINKVKAEKHSYNLKNGYDIYINCSDSGFINGKMVCDLYTTEASAVSSLTIENQGTNVSITGYSSGTENYKISNLQTGTSSVDAEISFSNQTPSVTGETKIGTIDLEQSATGLKNVVLVLKEVNNISVNNAFNKWYDSPKLTSLKIDGIETDLSSKNISVTTAIDNVKIEAVASNGATLSGDVGDFQLQAGKNEFSITVTDDVLTSYSETYNITVTYDLVSKITELQNKIIALQSKIESLDSLIESLQKENETLEGKNDQLNSTITDLNNKLEEVLEDISSLESSNSELENKYNELKAELEELHELTESILESNKNGTLNDDQLNEMDKLIDSMLDKKESNTDEKVKNPETSDKGIIFGVVSIVLIGSILTIKKKINAIRV